MQIRRPLCILLAGLGFWDRCESDFDVVWATNGDAATTARAHTAASSEGTSIFTENAASGALEFMDATNNTMSSLVPQVQIAAGETRPLLFSAGFDNSQLNFTPGTLLRAEIIVSFGNATAKATARGTWTSTATGRSIATKRASARCPCG